MEMAGASVVKTAEVLRAIEKTTKPAVENKFAKLEDIPDIIAGRVAAIIVNYDNDSLGRVSDSKAEQKKVRVKYLGHYAEVLEIPVYYLYKGEIEGIKKNLYLHPQAQTLKAAGAFQDSIRDLAAGLKRSRISQVVLGGVDEGQVVADAAMVLKKSGLEVHLMEDVYLETEGAPGPGKLDRLYHSGIVPSSFKIFVYDATEGIQSVLPKRWREMFREKLDKKEILWVDELPFVRDSQ
jgi:hypothetical protein